MVCVPLSKALCHEVCPPGSEWAPVRADKVVCLISLRPHNMQLGLYIPGGAEKVLWNETGPHEQGNENVGALNTMRSGNVHTINILHSDVFWGLRDSP